MFEELVVKSDDRVERSIGFAEVVKSTKREIVGSSVPSRRVGKVRTDCAFKVLDFARSFRGFDEFEFLL